MAWEEKDSVLMGLKSATQRMLSKEQRLVTKKLKPLL